jgi:hypothetical protein
MGRENRPGMEETEMTDRPILFSAPMVKALLAGRKTMTRRALKPQPVLHDGWEECGVGVEDGRLRVGRVIGNQRIRIAVGDRLWVREAFSYDALDVDHDAFMPAWYWADGNPEDGDWTKPKPSIHMPRALSRLTLTVTAVKVERLTEISEEDALAEGISVSERPILPHWPNSPYRSVFRGLWNSINGDEAWDSNPFVAAYTFTVEKRNIDA